MKIFLFVFLLLIPSVIFAKDEIWGNFYKKIIDAYVYEVSAEDLVVATLKGLNKVDNKLRVGNDSSRITLYYSGKVVKTIRKPQDANDVAEWGNLTYQIIDAAVNSSSEASRRDFEVMDILAAEMVKILDKDSKIYANFDEVKGISGRNQRTFAARLENNILYVKIAAFNKQTLQELINALGNYEKANALVLDLRGCPGGMPGEAIMAVDLFLDTGIIISSKGKDITEETYYNADAELMWQGKKIFVLVDEETASSAEILAVSLQEQGRAKIIGTSTKGKGSMQKLIELPTGSVVAVTNGFFITPSGNELNGKGVIPDICTFEMPDDKNIDNLLKQQDGQCYAESRSDTELEMNIVKTLM